MIKKLYNFTAKCKKNKFIVWPLIYKFNKLIINLLYPLIHYFDKKYGLDKKSDIIISLTTYPERINTVWITINTLLNQKNEKPKKIILWLAEEQFKDYKLPNKLTRLEKRGLEIKYCEDLKPHKKYYYTIKEFPNNYIITVDDDMFYPENLIEKLQQGSKKYKNAVICNWAHRITLEKNGKMNKYELWENSSNELSMQTIPIGCGGVLYPPNALNTEVMDKNKIKKMALYTDDLWLKCMEVKNNTLAININDKDIPFFNNIRNQSSGLWKNNTSGENRNDIVWKKLMEEYPDIEKKIVENERKL